MKTNYTRTLSVWMIGALTGALLMTACKSKDYKDTTEATTVATPDSVQAKMTADSIALQNKTLSDTSVQVRSKYWTAKPNPAKKHGKGSAGYMVNKDYEQQYMSTPIEMDKEGVYSRAEIKPSYPGGEKALAKFIQENINYPDEAIEQGVEGTVQVMFAVDENGRVYTPYVKGSRVGYGLDEEATRVVSKMPTWNPGQIKGKNVKSYYTLPISFMIQ